jgi:hypothetical protein
MTIKYRVFSSNATSVEVDSTESIRSITLNMGIPSKCRYRKTYEYIDYYVHRREYKCDGTGYLFSITDVL